MNLKDVKKKIISALIISNIMMFSFVVPVHAEGVVYDLQEYLRDWNNYLFEGVNENIQRDTLVILKKTFGSIGWLIDEGGMLWNKVKDAIHGTDSNIDSNSTDEEVKQWIADHTTVSGNGVTFDISMQNAINNYHDDYVANNKSYCYSYLIDDNMRMFNYTEIALAVRSIMTNNLNLKSFYVVRGIEFNSNNTYLYRYDLDQHPYLYAKPVMVNGTWNGRINFYDGATGDYIKADASYRFNPTTHEYDDYTYTSSGETACIASYDIDDKRASVPTSGNRTFVMTLRNVVAIRFFENQPNAGEMLTQPYYYNDQSWNNFQSSTGDYTVDNSNINTVTYGDTVSYINSFNTEEGYPPTIPEINNYITQQNEQNVTPDNGGGSGDNGGGSGGSGGSGSGSDGIFDFLSDLGGVLGNLISNLGQAITNIIRGISDLVTSIVTDLPTVFFDFIGSIFGWLPDEWVTLLSLSLAAMLIWGIVKVIRG